jgi:hypothetical protein
MTEFVEQKDLWKNSIRRMPTGKVVAVLSGKLEDRKLELIRPFSRALLSGEIHELIVTDEEQAGPTQTVNRIAYVCFFEIVTAGVMLVGDGLSIGGRRIGEIAGFDETHMPNHLNIVAKAEVRLSGRERQIQLDDKVLFRKRTQK